MFVDFSKPQKPRNYLLPLETFLLYGIQLIRRSLEALILGDDFCSIDGNVTLIDRISAIHVTYQMNQSQIMWFGQLVSLYPGIMVHLLNKCAPDKGEMVAMSITGE